MDGTILDISGVTSAQLRSLFVESVPPINGHPASTRFPDGDINNAYDWSMELTEQFADKTGRVQGAITTYAFPVADNLFAVGHNLSPIIDPLMGVLTSRNYGDQIAELVRIKLPRTFEAILAGAQLGSNGHGLIRVRTGGGTYWFFVGLLEPQHSGSMNFRNDLLVSVRDSAIGVLKDALSFPTNLTPELMQIYSGPDQIDRILHQVKSVAGIAEDLLDIFK